MSGDQWVQLVWIAAGMVLLASGLIARRLPARRTVAIALVWAGIFLLAFLIARAFA